MIGLILAINWLNLSRDRIALGFSFLLPVVFFSIFALLFGQWQPGSEELKPLDVLVVDQDHTDISLWFGTAIGEQKTLRPVSAPSATSRERVIEHIRAGDYAVAVVIPPGFGARFAAFDPETTPVEVLYDAANPMARFMLSGILQGAALTAAPALLLHQSIDSLERFSRTLPRVQRQPVETLLRTLRRANPRKRFDSVPTPSTRLPETRVSTSWVDTALQYSEHVRLPLRTTDVRGAEGNMIPYYAAGIGVMFLLFSMVGAGGSLLEEQETGTLERLLNSNLGIGTLLVGKWLFASVMAVAQLLVMFIWGALVFGLDLWTVHHLAGFLVMAVVTAMAAAAFGIVLGTLCRSRAQLSGISTIVVLIMSALGGSMAPRFLMPRFMHLVAKFTLNGWALDGFLKVFWYDDPHASLLRSLISLWPQAMVLTAITLVSLALAYVLSHRWETV